MRRRKAQLVAVSVEVLCPACGAAQPAPCGSEFWTPEDFRPGGGSRSCVSCEVPILIVNESKVSW